jgi:tripartite ATP-independent transporter DctM subunit
MFLLLLSGLQVAAALGIAGIIAAYIFIGKMALFEYISWSVGTNYVLISIPLFIFMGQLLLHSGLSSKLYEGSTALLGKIPGGLLHSNIIACSIFAAISGSSVATAATIGTVAIPELEKRGYEMRITLGSLAAGGTLGILIPPSIALIIYGVMTERPIAPLFIAGIIPGIMMSLLFMAYIGVRVATRPQLAPRFEKAPLKQRVLGIIGMWPIVVTIVVVLGGIYLGVMTATEAAGIGAFMALVFTLAFRGLNWSILKICLLETVKTSAMIMFLVVGAQMVTSILTFLWVTDKAIAWATSLPVSPMVILIFIYILYLFFGCFMDGVSLEVITLPIVFPVVHALGFDPIWFGIVLVLLIEMGMLTPPVGLNVYVIHGLRPKYPLSEVFLGIIPFFFMLAIGLTVLTIFPIIATWLPARMMGR